MGLIAALCGFVSLISTRPKTGRFYIKNTKNEITILARKWLLLIAMAMAAWFLASCRAIMMVGHSKKERKRREGEEIKPPTPCLWQAPASAPQKSFLSGELVTFYLPLL